ncbi:protein of unknown function DUF5320 [Tenacibaculum phage Larrie]|nr:protein of unknown function DUF5320 [Tenacibaculum phage Larrie]
MTQIKIGDRVKIKDFGRACTTYEDKFKEMGFKNTKSNYTNGLSFDDVFKVFSTGIHEDGTEMLGLERFGRQILISEVAVEKTKEELIMYKSDLKTGFVIENRDGKFGLVMKDTSRGDVIAANLEKNVEKTWCTLSSYNEDLTSKSNKIFDIVRVFDNLSRQSNNNAASLSDKGSLIWERPKPKKMTINDIEKELGYKIELVEN